MQTIRLNRCRAATEKPCGFRRMRRDHGRALTALHQRGQLRRLRDQIQCVGIDDDRYITLERRTQEPHGFSRHAKAAANNQRIARGRHQLGGLGHHHFGHLRVHLGRRISQPTKLDLARTTAHRSAAGEQCGTQHASRAAQDHAGAVRTLMCIRCGADTSDIDVGAAEGTRDRLREAIDTEFGTERLTMNRADVVERWAGQQSGAERQKRDGVIGHHGHITHQGTRIGVNAAGNVQREHCRAVRPRGCDGASRVAVDPLQWAFQTNAEQAVDDPIGADCGGDFTRHNDLPPPPFEAGGVGGRGRLVWGGRVVLRANFPLSPAFSLLGRGGSTCG